MPQTPRQSNLPHKDEIFIILYRNGNHSGPWRYNSFKQLCRYNDLLDHRLYYAIGSENPQEDRARMIGYMDFNGWVHPPNMSFPVSPGAGQRGAIVFRKIFNMIIYPDMKYSRLCAEFWDWIATKWREQRLSMYKHASSSRVIETDAIDDDDQAPFTDMMRVEFFESDPDSNGQEVTDFCHGVHRIMKFEEVHRINGMRKRILDIIGSLERELQGA